MSESFAKIVRIVSIVLTVIISISLIINLYEYSDTNNIWVSSEDKHLTVVVPVIVISAVVAVIVVLSLALKRRSGGETGEYELDPAIVAKRHLWLAIGEIIEIIIFCVITKETVLEFGIEVLDMDIYEAYYLVGQYSIFKNHMLCIDIVRLVSDMVFCVSYFNNVSAAGGFGKGASYRGTFRGNNSASERPVRSPSAKACPNCGFWHSAHEKICSNCKCDLDVVEKADKKCPLCQSDVTDEMKFCGKCGNKLD